MNDISHDHCYGIVVCTWCSSNFEEENGEDEEKKMTIIRIDQTTANDFLCLHKVIITRLTYSHHLNI